MAMSPRLLRPRATGFNPKSISGLALWLDASDSSSYTIATGVSEWRDKSGNNRTFSQSTGNNQPATGTQTMNGRNVLVFDGANDTLTNAAPFASTAAPWTIFFVQRIVSATNFGHSYSADGGSGFAFRQNSTTGQPQIQANAGVTTTTYGSSAVGVNQVHAMLFPASGSITAFLNGASLSITGDSSTAPTMTNSHIIGGRSALYFGNVWIAEILFYNALLSASQRSIVQKSLGRKWGITVA
jgi:hypothetical protein